MEKLNGNNYFAWSAAVEIWFLEHGLEDHLTHTISTIRENNRALWQKVDVQLLSLMWQTVEPTLMPIFQSLHECSALWTYAHELYTSDITHICDVIGALFRL